MEILGNMKFLTILSRVLTSLGHQNGYFECGESQRYHYGRCAMLKLIYFCSAQIQTGLSSKKGKKEQKMKNCKKKFSSYPGEK